MNNVDGCFKYPTRDEKKKGCRKYNTREEKLLFYKSQEYSESQALFLYTFNSSNVSVFLPQSFIKDVKNKNKYLKISRRDFEVIWTCDGNGSGNLVFPPGFFEFISKNKMNKEYLIFSLHFWSCSRNSGGHANLLIYNTKADTLERFEPNGGCSVKNEWYDSIAFDNAMKKKINIKYLPPQTPENGWQRIQIEQERNFKVVTDLDKEEVKLRRGFCVMWTIIFLKLRITSDKSSKQIIEDFIKDMKDKNYLNYIQQETVIYIKKVCNLFL